jgi:GGDEF domain-containing protein/sensor domain CHASE-containing protein
MQKTGLLPKENRCIYPAVFVAILLFIVCLSFSLLLHSSIRQRETLELTDRFMAFESRVERLIYSNVTLLQGFEAYIKSNPDLDEQSAYRYLNDLLSNNSDCIRNIGVIKDTTIIWNYPKAGNAVAIGVDLTKVEGQRDSVLKVKNELKPTFQGPIDLIQGGTGFSVRLPIMRDDTGYWGQTSIILKTDRILDEIASFARSAELDVAIYNSKNDTPFFGSAKASDDSMLAFEVDPSFINWKVYVKSPSQSYVNTLLIALLIIAAVISASGGFFAHKYLKSSYKIRDMSTRDFLTGLFNRHFLDEFQTIALSAAQRENRKAAILMIDINHFKKINDTYGHSVGDKVLVETARILQSATRTNEAAFRLGGDEFLLMLPAIESAATLIASTAAEAALCAGIRDTGLPDQGESGHWLCGISRGWRRF